MELNECLEWIVENAINLVACFFEIIMILYCIHGIFKMKWKPDAVTCMLIAIDIVVMSMIHAGIVGKLATIFVYVALYIFCYYRFKCKILETTIRFVICFVMMALLQIASSVLVMQFSAFIKNEEIVMLLINIVSFIIAVLIFEFSSMRQCISNLRFDGERWGYLIVLCGMTIAFIMFDYRYRGEVNQFYYFVLLVFYMIVCFTTIAAQKSKHEYEKRKMELQIEKKYKSTYDELLIEVRQRQHDFMNQLSAIYSTHLTATSLEDLKEKQKRYIQVILDKRRYDKILTGCVEPILAGYLYNLCSSLEAKDIEVKYTVIVNQAKCKLTLYEIIEILGILVMNAAESFSENTAHRTIMLMVVESNDAVTIGVSNEAKDLTTQDVNKMFELGYSSKGNNRGLGLPRVKQLVKESNSRLYVKKMGTNWIDFKVIIPKVKDK